MFYRTEFYFQDYKLAIEIYKNGQSDRNIDYEIKIQKSIEQELGCNFIRIDRDKEDFNILRAINEVFRQIRQVPKKTLINKISTRLLGLEFQ